MNFIAELGRIKESVDRELLVHFDRKIREVRKKDIFLADALEHTKKITLSGGKRLRPALVFCGAGEVLRSDRKNVLRVACAIELVHSFLLIHDDIIDCGDVRHGVSTANAEYAMIGKRNFNLPDPQHFGNSMAIILGDFVYAMAMELILESSLPESTLCAVVEYLQKIVQNTIIGQSQDIEIECDRKATKKTVLMMYKNKTSKYSFETPLHVGLMLGERTLPGASRTITDFSNHVGLAFQIQDDIIGIFGKVAETGKSNTSDIEQGKKTILVLETLERLGVTERKRFSGILGKRQPSRDDVVFFQQCMRESGALEHCEKVVRVNLRSGRQIIGKSGLDESTKLFLLGIVDYLENRQY